MITEHYTSPHQFEPLLPQFRLDELRSHSRSVIEKADRLSSIIGPDKAASLRALVRSSNAYYSNWLENQSTSSENIERALHNDFSDEPGVAKLQRLAVAHIEAEKWLEMQVVAGKPCLSNESHTTHYGSCLSSDFLKETHTSLYGRLSIKDRTEPDGRVLIPGALREVQVCVGRHEPPLWSTLPSFLDRMNQVYSKRRAPEDLLIYVAAAHHRAAWVHPFPDGNGRAIRLQTHCALLPISSGLWSISRGIALDRDRYYSFMDAADASRQGDLDGRGNLSEKALWAWCEWFISAVEGQVDFVANGVEDGSLLNPETESGKFAARREARTLALHQLFADKIRQDPALMNKAKATLARWRLIACANSQPYLIEWERLIGLGVDACLAVMVEDSQYAAALRKSSPFTGILTEKERADFQKSWGIEVVEYDIFAHVGS